MSIIRLHLRDWALLTSAMGAAQPADKRGCAVPDDAPCHTGLLRPGDNHAPNGPQPPDPASGAEGGLVARARGGDRGAFDELFRRYVDDVYRRTTRLIGADPEREDLVQEVFVSAYRGLPRFRGDAAFSTWLYTIVVRIAYKHLAKRRRRPLADTPLTEQLSTICGAATPEQCVAEKQELLRLHRMLERLKPKKRVAFIMRRVEGLSLVEIAAIVGATPAAVGQRVKHAQRELETMVARDTQRGLALSLKGAGAAR